MVWIVKTKIGASTEQTTANWIVTNVATGMNTMPPAKQQFQENYPEMKHTEVMTQLRAMWKALNDTEKTEYEFNFKKSRQFLSTIFYQVED